MALTVVKLADTLAANACRLFDDAKFLAEHGRYPTAVVAAILAIEEVGKYHVYRWKLDDPAWLPARRLPPHHRDKQAAFAAPFVGIIQMRAMCEICAQLGAPEWDRLAGGDDWEKTQDFLVEGYLVSQHGETPAMRERAADILNAVSEYVEVRVDHHPLACLMGLADSGETEKAKHAALYVDVAENGTAMTDPAAVDERAARFWIDVAEVGITSLTSLKAAEAAGDAFVRRYTVVPGPRKPTPRASTEDWRRLIEQMQEQRGSGHRP